MAGKAHKIKSVTFSSTAILGIQNVDENDTAEAMDKHRADTSACVEAVFLDGVGAQIVVTTTDLSVRSTWALGVVGSLVVVKEQRANGTGATAGQDKTATYAAAVLVAKGIGAPFQGKGSLVLTFEATDPTGASVVTHS
ncbi:hypothetical protein [Methylibium sp.]|uniref:hypothetical protein n=1 Tax=Methylibium sp. TaxID=2067992 RepID=UPI0017995D5D|nr:hypothetical protein [Methylibium sp.]MBA3588850.1 hypothetical protein [Methylibium sp.]